MKQNKYLEPFMRITLQNVCKEISNRQLYITKQELSKSKKSVYLTITNNKNRGYYKLRISDHAGNPSKYDLGLWVEKRTRQVNNIEKLNSFLDEIQSSGNKLN